MNSIASASPAHDQRVTASELVRHFGIWQDRAGRAPVYILHRGRPRLVLTSIDVMDALCSPLTTIDRGDTARLESLLGATREIVLWLHRDGTIVAASRAARAIFGNDAVPIDRIASIGGSFLAATAERVLVSGVEDSVDVVPALYPTRRWSCRIEPTVDGAMLIAHDVTDDAALAASHAAAAAAASAMLSAGCVASARIGLRGYLDAPSPTLVALTGVDAESLATARFVSLFEIGSRVAIGNALEAAIGDGASRAVNAILLINRGDPISVTAAFSPIRRGAATEAAHVLIVNRAIIANAA